MPHPQTPADMLGPTVDIHDGAVSVTTGAKVVPFRPRRTPVPPPSDAAMAKLRAWLDDPAVDR